MDNEAQIKRIWDSLEQSRKEADKHYAQIRKESDERMARVEAGLNATDKLLDKVGRKLDKVSEEYGGLSNNLGEQLEVEFVEAVRAKGQIGDAKLHRVIHTLKNIHEYDLVALNDTAVFVGEIKQKLLPQDVERFVAERLPHFADEFPPHAKGRKVYGMVGGANIVPDAKELAKKHGLILLTLEGRTLQTTNTENARAI